MIIDLKCTVYIYKINAMDLPKAVRRESCPKILSSLKMEEKTNFSSASVKSGIFFIADGEFTLLQLSVTMYFESMKVPLVFVCSLDCCFC